MFFEITPTMVVSCDRQLLTRHSGQGPAKGAGYRDMEMVFMVLVVE